MARITRRRALAGLAAVASGPLTGRAFGQSRTDRRRLGVLALSGANDLVQQGNAAALTEGLTALGWRDGVNLHIDWRLARGDHTLLERYAAELVALSSDVVLAVGSPPVNALRRQTTTIPIVFTIVTDPVGQGLVASLAQPGGNVTGFTDFDAPMAGKWLGMMMQISPPPTRLAALYNPATAPFASLMLRALAETSPSPAPSVHPAPIGDAAQIEATVAQFAAEDHSGLLVLPDAFTMTSRAVIIAAAKRARLPAVYWQRIFAAEGGLMSYGTDNADQYRRAAGYIDRILKGAKPADLPIQNPTKFEMTINRKTAKRLDVTLSPALLAAADEVIE